MSDYGSLGAHFLFHALPFVCVVTLTTTMGRSKHDVPPSSQDEQRSTVHPSKGHKTAMKSSKTLPTEAAVLSSSSMTEAAREHINARQRIEKARKTVEVEVEKEKKKKQPKKKPVAAEEEETEDAMEVEGEERAKPRVAHFADEDIKRSTLDKIRQQERASVKESTTRLRPVARAMKQHLLSLQNRRFYGKSFRVAGKGWRAGEPTVRAGQRCIDTLIGRILAGSYGTLRAMSVAGKEKSKPKNLKKMPTQLKRGQIIAYIKTQPRYKAIFHDYIEQYLRAHPKVPITLA